MNYFKNNWRKTASLLFTYYLITSCSIAQATDTLRTNSFTEAVSFVGVVELDLAKEKLAQLPDSVFLIEHLVTLNLSKNRLEELPARIGELKELKLLNLSRNKLKHLPKEITDLSELKILVIDRNPLTTLPNDIGKLTKLEQLILWDTELNYLPASIAACNKLTFLDLRTVVMTKEEQSAIRANLPSGAEAKFSMPCKCN